MAVIWTRSGIMKPENYKQAIEGSEEMVKAFRERTGMHAGLYHQMGGDIGRLGLLTVFDDLAQFQKIMADTFEGRENADARQAHAGYFLPESRRETIWVRRDV